MFWPIDIDPNSVVSVRTTWNIYAANADRKICFEITHHAVLVGALVILFFDNNNSDCAKRHKNLFYSYIDAHRSNGPELFYIII